MSVVKLNYQAAFINDLITIYTAYYQAAQAAVSDPPAGDANTATMTTGFYAAAAQRYWQTLQGYQQQYNNIQSQIFQAIAHWNEADNCVRLRRQKKIDQANLDGQGDNPIQVLGGEDFPQNQEITICIDGGLFTGSFSGNAFTVTSSNSDELTAAAYSAYNSHLLDLDVCQNTTMKQLWTWKAQIPNWLGSVPGIPAQYSTNSLAPSTVTDPNLGGQYSFNGIVVNPPDPPVASTSTSPPNADPTAATTVYVKNIWYSWTPSATAEADRQPVIQQFWAEPGASVTLHPNDATTYIVSVTPGTVLSVRAYKQVSNTGLIRLVDVPSNLYTIQQVTYGTITATEVVLTQPLSHILNEGWRDEIYVTFQSTIGPNVVDILQYIIQQYTNLAIDPTSFAHVWERLIPFPANFPINDRRNVLQVLQELAFQSRCALWLDNGTVYLLYLPERPTPVDTITVSDIEADHGVEVELTPTEDLVTKMAVNWHLRCATGAAYNTTLPFTGSFSNQGYGFGSGIQPVASASRDTRDTKDNMYSVVLRHNIIKYLVHEATYDFYAFNQPDIIYKMATFWLIRKSHIWKRIKFTTPLHKLAIEPFDAVTLNFDEPYVGVGSILAIVESAKYDSLNNCIHFQCLTPVETGTSSEYLWFWPADLPASDTWPPASEIEQGYAGTGGPGSGASGPLPVGDTSTISSTVFVGGTNVVFGPHSDYGDSTPTDTGFQAQSVVNSGYYSTTPTTQTALDLTVDYADKLPTQTTAFVDMYVPPAPNVVLDINKTGVTDGTSTALLSGVLKLIAAQPDNNQPAAQLALSSTAQVTDGTNAAVFDFEYDTVGQKWGAGTAFLQDTSTGGAGGSGGT